MKSLFLGTVEYCCVNHFRKKICWQRIFGDNFKYRRGSELHGQNALKIITFKNQCYLDAHHSVANFAVNHIMKKNYPWVNMHVCTHCT